MANISNFSSNNPNPVTGVFGTGRVIPFPVSKTFVVPAGITSVRVRMWGCGGNSAANNYGGQGGGGGAGFAIKTITGLTPGESIVVTVGDNAGSKTSSFGAYVSATGGGQAYGSGPGSAGTGSGGDLNFTGGNGGFSSNTMSSGGGGSASFFGNGGEGGGSTNIPGAPSPKGGAGGGGAYYSYGTTSNGAGTMFAQGGVAGVVSGSNPYYTMNNYIQPTTGNPTNSIDFFGCGGGGAGMATNYMTMSGNSGVNGGGGGGNNQTNSRSTGGFPGGGGAGTVGIGGNGYVYLEY